MYRDPTRVGGVANVAEHGKSGLAPHTRVMFVDSCCRETKNAILAGVGHVGARPTPSGQTHLKPLQDKLSSGVPLAEYCYMIWGLS